MKGWTSGLSPKQSSPEYRDLSFCRWCLDMALSRPVTALDNERFTVQSGMLHYAVPVVLVREARHAGQGRGPDLGGHVSGEPRVPAGASQGGGGA